jgi:hypothetical protein
MKASPSPPTFTPFVRGLFTACLAVLVMSPCLDGAAAQTSEGNDDSRGPGSWIISDPQGALVELGGGTRLRGFTPWRLDDRVRGSYSLKARMPGYETWEGNILLDGSRNETYSLKLAPKTRTKALLRSLFIPGWGQRYAGHPRRANLLFLAEAASLIGLGITHERYQDRVNDWEEARDVYLAETVEENLPSLRAKVDRQRERADDAYSLRQAFFWSSVGIMAFNIVDVLLFTSVGPSSGVFYVRPTQLSLQGVEGPGATLAFSFRF